VQDAKQSAKRTDPTTPITDKRFKYVPSAATNVTKTWERAKKRIAAEKQAALAQQTPQLLALPCLVQVRLKRSNG
jgi:hypothetical protein